LVALLLLRGTVYGQGRPAAVRIDLDQAIQLALTNNHALKAARTQIPQSQDQEVTAGLRPNPVLTLDSLYLPLFSPHELNGTTLDNTSEFDAGISYLLERGHKRQARLRAARDQTNVARLQVSDVERALTFNVAQQFIGALLGRSNLEFARGNLASFEHTVDLSETRFKAGDLSEGDFLKTKVQLLQFQTDVTSAELAFVQSLASLRQLLGYEAVPLDYDIVGELAYSPLRLNQDDMRALALKQRPDLLAAEQGVSAAESQHDLAKANGKRDLTTSVSYTHVAALNNASFAFNIDIPLFNRNQGEIARTQHAITQSQENSTEVTETVMTDVSNAYEAVRTNETVVKLYLRDALKKAQDSRDISEFAYRQGAASLLDFLDAERSYRSTQLAYRQALAAYMLSLEQLRLAVGTRSLP
jgi:cobalt-zinc-cadmium efflux system outer membrane protein